MNRKRVVRVIAIVLALLLAGGAVVSALISAWAETAPAARDACEMTIEVLQEEQALQIEQRLVYTNRTDAALESVSFYLPANMFRRESALVYESDALEAAFPAGYAPGGVEFRAVTVDGAPADWGVMGENELFLRVACALAPGASCAFGFEFTVLYTENNAFCGAGATDLRFSGFYPLAALTDTAGDFVLNPPLSFARTTFAPLTDYAVELTVPATYDLACAGTVEALGEDRWRATCTAHEFAFSLSRRWRRSERTTAGGETVRLFSNLRLAAPRALACAAAALEQCEAWFGPLPGGSLTLAQSDCVPDSLAFDGLVWLSSDLLAGDAAVMEREIRRRVAEQYFGFIAYVDPAADAWLTDAVSLYAAYLLYEEEAGPDAYLAALNRDLLPALQVTMPGGLEITSAASLFTGSEYRIIVCERGAAVLHQLRCAMGRDALLDGLARFVRKGRAAEALGEYDLVDALEEATGRSWEAYLADWLFHIDEYNVQRLDWLD